MPILILDHLEKYFGATPILTDVDLEIEPGQKLALVGRNGCGKSTLLKIIAGAEEADRGRMSMERGIRLGLLRQESAADDETRTIWAEMELLFAPLRAIESEAQAVAAAMAASDGELPDLMQRYARMQEEFEQKGGYAIRARIESVLRGVGFTESDWAKPQAVLSGGERTRVALARLLLDRPELLLLDEPTNHLDLWAIGWLEEYLASYEGAILVVSHDRYFLNRVVRGVYELAEGVTRFFPGNYSAYRAARDEMERVRQHQAEIQAREIARKERLVRESAADERSKRQARSIAKSLGRMEPVQTLPGGVPAPRIRLASAGRTGRFALRVESLQKSYGNRRILAGVSFAIESGERVGLIGPNGAGKTTLLRLIQGMEPAEAGQVSFGHNVQPAYFAQDGLSIQARDDETVFSYLQAAGGGDNQATRSHLAQFLFRGEEVWKKVSDLSGGERRRLALARLTLSQANLLILDEPTNHLDLPSIEALEEGMAGYGGTILVVSHDRYFLGRIANRLLTLVDGDLRSFPDYEAFAAWHAASEERAAATRGREMATRREEQRRAREIRLAPGKEERRRLKALAALETDLDGKEEERRALLAEMEQPAIASDYKALHEVSLRLSALEECIAQLYAEWEAVLDES